MIAMVEGAKRGTHAERDRAVDPARDDDAGVPARHRDARAVLAVRGRRAGHGSVVTITVLVALLVCLIPTTIGALLSAIGIAGMDRMVRANVIATSGRAVEAAGDVDVLLLDKTGTITLGDRQASAFHPGARRQPSRSSPTPRSSRRSPTKRPRAARSSCSRSRSSSCAAATWRRRAHTFHKFSAQTRMSGVDLDGRQLRKGAADAIRKFVEAARRHVAGEGQRGRRHGRAHRRHAAGRGRRSPRARRRSSCATSSRAASASASPSCGRWASRPSWSPATTA